jgi:hypothetical protein
MKAMKAKTATQTSTATIFFIPEMIVTNVLLGKAGMLLLQAN